MVGKEKVVLILLVLFCYFYPYFKWLCLTVPAAVASQNASQDCESFCRLQTFFGVTCLLLVFAYSRCGCFLH